MALVTTTVTPTVRITPFTGISEVQRERSGIARSEVVYSGYGTWPSTGVGDNRSIAFSFSLDPDYGYTLMDSNAAFIINTDYIDMEATGVMEIATDTRTGSTESQWYQYENDASRMVTDLSGATAIGSVPSNQFNTLYPITGQNAIMVFTMRTKPTALLYPFPGVSGIDCTAMWGEGITNQPAMAYRFYTRFLQYDITQGYNYVVSSPQLTR
jgi:hypothetical protein